MKVDESTSRKARASDFWALSSVGFAVIAFARAQAGISKSTVPASRRGDCPHQSHLARLGAVLCGRPVKPVFSYIRDWVAKKIRTHLVRVRLEAVEQGAAHELHRASSRPYQVYSPLTRVTH